ncbi:hypothetical protein JCM3765_001832 [Sporobolomyces pararoseus]
MSTELSKVIQIDRLSSLPPELLSPIFDLAHDPEEPLREPLSRALLPYFRQTLYREIRISSSSSLSKFLTTVQANSNLACLVRDLSTREADYHPTYPLKAILRHLPSLRSLQTPKLLSLSCGIDSPTPPTLTSLRVLSYSCNTLSNADLDILSQLQNLQQLEIGFAQYGQEEESNCASLEGVQRLELTSYWRTEEEEEEPCPWTESLANFIDRFPHLTKLVLGGERDPRYKELLSSLNEINKSLKSLELWSPEQGDEFDFACDHLLPRFPNLEHLCLGDGTVSTDLPLHLAQLAHLQTLTLGYETHYSGLSARQLLPLVQGSTRCVTLRSLVLDSFDGGVGKRFDVGDNVNRDPLRLLSWNVPEFGNHGGWDAADIWRLKEAAEANGVEVRGSTFEGLRASELAVLERANRLILLTYQTKSFKEYIVKRASPLVQPRLPDLDIEKLDPNNLKLVKVDLPEEDWYQFTLE